MNIKELEQLHDMYSEQIQELRLKGAREYQIELSVPYVLRSDVLRQLRMLEDDLYD